MQPFSDFLPKETQNQFVEANLKIGSVLKFKVSFKNGITKYKIQVIVGINNGKTLLASVFVNSEINPNVFHNQNLKDLHLQLEADGRDFLDHDSFVDCSDIIEYDINETQKRLLQNPKIHIGHLSDDDLASIRDKIRGAKTISKKKKTEFGLYL